MPTAFRDPDIEPTSARIHAALGPAGDAWDELTGLLTEAGLDLTWRYYRDGGWLAKATNGKKTIAWLSVEPGQVKITFYFAERHRTTLAEDPTLSAGLRERIGTAAMVPRALRDPRQPGLESGRIDPAHQAGRQVGGRLPLQMEGRTPPAEPG